MKVIDSGVTRHNVEAPCYCHDYQLNRRCAHWDSIMVNTRNLLRIQSISRWCETSSTECNDLNWWDKFQIPTHEKIAFDFGMHFYDVLCQMDLERQVPLP